MSEHVVVANELAHHVVEWTPRGEPRGLILLAHGFLDLAWSWRWVAEPLAAEGWRCLAWDWRGHGETEHVGRGGYYHFPDYAMDLTRLLDDPRFAGEPTHLIGHSMGGTIAAMVSGLRASRFASVALVEGIGPPTWPFERTPEKYGAWIDGMARLRVRPEREMADLDGVVARMRLQNPSLDDARALFLAEKSTRPLPSGRLAWRFDRKHRTTSPMPFRIEVFAPFLERLTMPVLYVAGERGFRVADEAARLAQIPGLAETVEVPGQGHMLHRDAPDAVVDAWRSFERGLAAR